MPMNLENTAALRSNAGAVEKATDNPGEERELTDAQLCHALGPLGVRCVRKLGHSGEHSILLAWKT